LQRFGIHRVDGNLAVARAVGEKDMPAINPRAKITKVPLKDLSVAQTPHLVIACDGLWDVATSRQVSNTIQADVGKKSLTEIAKGLVTRAIAAQSSDNVSALVVDLRPLIEA
jgi:serine/threonine protein phosphatase PrpC